MAAGLTGIPAVEEDMHLLVQQNQEESLCLMEGESQSQQKWAPNLIWREKVVQWSYDVVDHLNEERRVVYIAINILDRFCASKASNFCKIDEKAYEIASLSSIFLAVRIAGSGNLLISELVSMSRGGISTQDIISTGTAIVKELSWEDKILAPVDFVKSFLQLVPSVHRGILDSASYLTEIAVCDVVLSHSKASFLAVAACLNVLRSDLPSAVPAFIKAVRDTTAIETDSNEFQVLCSRLADVYGRSLDSSQEQGQANIDNNKIHDCFDDCGPHLIEDYDDEDDFDDATSKRSYIRYDGVANEDQDTKRTKLGV